MIFHIVAVLRLKHRATNLQAIRSGVGSHINTDGIEAICENYSKRDKAQALWLRAMSPDVLLLSHLLFDYFAVPPV